MYFLTLLQTLLLITSDIIKTLHIQITIEIYTKIIKKLYQIMYYAYLQNSISI